MYNYYCSFSNVFVLVPFLILALFFFYRFNFLFFIYLLYFNNFFFIIRKVEPYLVSRNPIMTKLLFKCENFSSR